MKKLLLFVLVMFVFAACKKNTVVPAHSGVLLGYDMRMCPSPMCGGLLITLNNDTAKNPPSYYHIGASLEQLGLDPKTKFPVNVDLSYKPDTGVFATYHYIIVTQIRIVK